MFKKIRKIFNIMSDKDIEELKESYSNYSYQWIKGDNMSQVQHYSDIIQDGNKKYIIFTDKSRMSLDLLDEYMVRIDKGFEEIPSMSIRNPLEDTQQSRGVKSRELSISTPAIQESPIFSLLGKQKENWIDVDLKLSINLPSKSLWDILMDSFEDAEKDILEYVTKDLDIEVVRQSLRESIKDIYKKQKNSTPTKNVRSQDSL